MSSPTTVLCFSRFVLVDENASVGSGQYHVIAVENVFLGSRWSVS